MSLGEMGKRPVSDRDAVIRELKAQGKWEEESRAESKANKTGIEANTGTKPGNIPFISSFWVLAIVLGAVLFLKKRN